MSIEYGKMCTAPYITFEEYDTITGLKIFVVVSQCHNGMITTKILRPALA